MADPSPAPSQHLLGDGFCPSPPMQFLIGDDVWPEDTENSSKASVLEDFKLIAYGFGNLPGLCTIQKSAHYIALEDSDLGLLADVS